MGTLTRRLRPRRRLAVPFLAVLLPLLWVAVPGSNVSRGGPIVSTPLGLAAFLVVAVVASYALAVVTTAPCPTDPEAMPHWLRPVVAPTDGALLGVAGTVAAAAAYVLLSGSGVVPAPLDALARAVGIVVGWPLVATVLGLTVVGNAFAGGSLPFVARSVGTMLGLALSAVWMVVLADGLVRLGERVHRRLG